MGLQARAGDNGLGQPARTTRAKGVDLSDSPRSQHGIAQRTVGGCNPLLVRTEYVAHDLAPRLAACPATRRSEVLAY